jgi:excisionase family DNA binding protein
MRSYKFEDLPNLIGELFVKIENIEKLLQEKSLNSTVAEDELLTISDAAKLLNLSVATIYTKVCKNEIPVNKQGSVCIFIGQNYWTGLNPAGLKLYLKFRKILNQKLILNNQEVKLLLLRLLMLF